MKKILVLGAGFLQDFVIKKAVSMGYETLALDADPNAVGFSHATRSAIINITDKISCLDYAKKERINGVITAATDYGVVSAAYIAQEMGLLGLNYETAKLIKNKFLVRKCLYENHVDGLGKAYEVGLNTDIDYLAKKLDYPVMVKPSDGSGSRGTSKVSAVEQLKAACDIAIGNSLTKKAAVEPFVEGDEYGAESIVINGNIHVLTVMKKTMTDPPYYAELGHCIPSGLSPNIEQKVISCVKKAILALNIDFGAVNCDLLITKNGDVNIVDIGARMGGNMIGPCIVPYGTGIDYMAAVIKSALGETVDLTARPHGVVATKLLAFKKGIVNELPDFNSIEKEYGVEIYHHMSKGMLINEYHTNLDGCGYIVSKGENVLSAEENATKAYDRIKTEIFEV